MIKKLLVILSKSEGFVTGIIKAYWDAYETVCMSLFVIVNKKFWQ
jgi:hypothetical protein